MAFTIDWCGGAAAQVELFAPRKGVTTFQFKYTPAYRSTIRPPVQELPLGETELDPVDRCLDEVVKILGRRSRGAGGTLPAGVQSPAPNAVEDRLQLAGSMLAELAIPRSVRADLRGAGLFVELGMEESLLGYPWELIYDGETYLCLRHNLGRFVNGGTLVGAARPASWHGQELAPLRVLLVSVPAPQPRSDATYEPLADAREETRAIAHVLAGVAGVEVKLLEDRDATHAEVFLALRQADFQIFHFNGHAFFNDRCPYSSGVALFDRDMTTGQLGAFLGARPPVLCFINACETTRTAAEVWHGHYDVFGLARAVLEAGSYLLGSRWRISDRVASLFAKSFYGSLLVQGRPLGQAVRDARLACCDVPPAGDMGWASYLFYGDPRVTFRPVV